MVFVAIFVVLFFLETPGKRRGFPWAALAGHGSILVSGLALIVLGVVKRESADILPAFRYVGPFLAMAWAGTCWSEWEDIRNGTGSRAWLSLCLFTVLFSVAATVAGFLVA